MKNRPHTMSTTFDLDASERLLAHCVGIISAPDITVEQITAAADDLAAECETLMAEVKRLQAEAKNIPYEVRALARFYTTDADYAFWTCLVCGGEWPCNLVAICATCHGPKESTR